MKLTRYRKPPAVTPAQATYLMLSGASDDCQTEHHGMVSLAILDPSDLDDQVAARAKLRGYLPQAHDHEIDSMIEQSFRMLDHARRLQAMHERAVEAWIDRDLSVCLDQLNDSSGFEISVAGRDLLTRRLRAELIRE